MTVTSPVPRTSKTIKNGLSVFERGENLYKMVYLIGEKKVGKK